MWKNRLLCLGLVLCLLRGAVRPGGAKPLLPDASTRKTSPCKKKKAPVRMPFVRNILLWFYRKRLCVSVSPGAALRLFHASSR